MYKKILIGLSAMMFSVSAFAQLQSFTGHDSGVAAGNPRPNSDAARNNFLAAFPPGVINVDDMESYALGAYPVLMQNSVTASCSGSSLSATINDSDDTILGYNTTAGGEKHFRISGSGAGQCTYSFNLPVQAFGAYFTGAGTTPSTIRLNFSDGTSRQVTVPGSNNGGVSFGGFTDPGKFISSVQVASTNFGDVIGIDDMTTVESTDVARFRVTKTYADGNNTASVDVSIQCNDGNPSSGTASLKNGQSHTFVVGDLSQNSGVTCTITESGTTGYSSNLPNGCTFNDVGARDYTCAFRNSPRPVTVTVNKDWVIPNNDPGLVVDQTAELRIYCDGNFLGRSTIVGDGSFSRTYTPQFPSSNCYATEDVVNSAVEQQNLGCGSMTIRAGQGASCTFVNTVFYEGIPTLSQYGLAVLALLMLGVGFIGFRRFV